MDFVFLNEQLEQDTILEEYESVIWTDRYFEAGECEIYTPVSAKLLDLLQSNPVLYLWNSESRHLMYINGYSINTTFDEGDKLLITGDSIEKILERRIVWTQTKFSGSLNDGIKKLLNENVINPSDPNRKIDNIYYQDTTDPYILAMNTEFDVHGVSLYSFITELCRRHKIGLRMIMDDNDHFVVSLYIGEDRSYDQSKNNYVLFSSDFENLGQSNFVHTTKSYCNVTEIVVSRDESGIPNKIIELNPDNSSGLNRREMLTDPGGVDKPESYFISKGRDDLRDHRMVTAFEGQIEATQTFVYGEDFFIGDIVQVENEYHMTSKSRVIELVMHQTSDTLEIYPTFEAI